MVDRSLTSELRSCPFCGSTSVAVMEHGKQSVKTKPHYFYGNCLPCDAEGPPAPTAKEAAQRWNGRVS